MERPTSLMDILRIDEIRDKLLEKFRPKELCGLRETSRDLCTWTTKSFRKRTLKIYLNPQSQSRPTLAELIKWLKDNDEEDSLLQNGTFGYDEIHFEGEEWFHRPDIDLGPSTSPLHNQNDLDRLWKFIAINVRTIKFQQQINLKCRSVHEGLLWLINRCRLLNSLSISPFFFTTLPQLQSVSADEGNNANFQHLLIGEGDSTQSHDCCLRIPPLEWNKFLSKLPGLKSVEARGTGLCSMFKAFAHGHLELPLLNTFHIYSTGFDTEGEEREEISTMQMPDRSLNIKLEAGVITNQYDQPYYLKNLLKFAAARLTKLDINLPETTFGWILDFKGFDFPNLREFSLTFRQFDVDQKANFDFKCLFRMPNLNSFKCINPRIGNVWAGVNQGKFEYNELFYEGAHLPFMGDIETNIDVFRLEKIQNVEIKLHKFFSGNSLLAIGQIFRKAKNVLIDIYDETLLEIPLAFPHLNIVDGSYGDTIISTHIQTRFQTSFPHIQLLEVRFETEDQWFDWMREEFEVDEEDA